MNFRRLSLLLLASLLVSPFALAQERTLRLVVGLAPGGAHDITSRALAEKLREILGHPVIVENKPGAGQRLALQDVRRAAPDGRTVLIASNSPFVIFPHTFSKLDYDPVKDFTPIARLLASDSAIGVGANVPVRNLKELTAWAKKNSKPTPFGTPGAGTLPHFVGVSLAKELGIELVHVPYKGGAPAMLDFQGGHLPMIINALSDMADGHKAGKYRIIASSGAQRSPILPDVPTLRESGYNIVSQGGVWVYGPPGMPAEIVNSLNAAMVKAVTQPDFREKFTKLGMTVAPTSPAELAKLQAEETKFWEGPVKASGFREN
jgi:tripartite-type tricarboxylate transporter receptor subunit TctC